MHSLGGSPATAAAVAAATRGHSWIAYGSFPALSGRVPSQAGLSSIIPHSQPQPPSLRHPPSAERAVLGTPCSGTGSSGAVPCSPGSPSSSGGFIARGHRVAVSGALLCLCPQGQVAKTPLCWERGKDQLGAAALGTLGTKRHNPDTTCPEVWKHLE